MGEAQTLRAREHPHIVPLLASYIENTIESDIGVRSVDLLYPYSQKDVNQWL